MARAESVEDFRDQAAAAKGKPDRIKRYGARFPSEHDEQAALFLWAERQTGVNPALAWMFAIPNAGAGAQKGQAGKMKAEGVKAGVPDICLPVALHGYHGMYLEMKSLDGELRGVQRNWLNQLKFLGYHCAVARGFAAGREALLAYLRGDVPRRPA